MIDHARYRKWLSISTTRSAMRCGFFNSSTYPRRPYSPTCLLTYRFKFSPGVGEIKHTGCPSASTTAYGEADLSPFRETTGFSQPCASYLGSASEWLADAELVSVLAPRSERTS